MDDSRENEALKIFLNRDRKELASSISIACDYPVESIKSIKTRIDYYYKKENGSHKPAEIAEHWHDMMLLGCINNENENFHEYESFFVIVHAAESVADQACANAFSSPGKLKQLSDLMCEIQRREGLQKDEYWRRSEGPDDYKIAEEQFERLDRNINNAVISCVLRMYGFEDYARLLDENQIEFEIRREAGRRASCSSEDNENSMEAEQLMEKQLAKEYGSEVVKLLYEYLQEIRNYHIR